MVTMTSEVDKTQTSLAMITKSTSMAASNNSGTTTTNAAVTTNTTSSTSTTSTTTTTTTSSTNNTTTTTTNIVAATEIITSDDSGNVPPQSPQLQATSVIVLPATPSSGSVASIGSNNNNTNNISNNTNNINNISNNTNNININNMSNITSNISSNITTSNINGKIFSSNNGNDDVPLPVSSPVVIKKAEGGGGGIGIGIGIGIGGKTNTSGALQTGNATTSGGTTAATAPATPSAGGGSGSGMGVGVGATTKSTLAPPPTSSGKGGGGGGGGSNSGNSSGGGNRGGGGGGGGSNSSSAGGSGAGALAAAAAAAGQGQQSQQQKNEDAPNILVYKKMEAIIEKMQAESTGVAVRTVKAFMSKVPSVFTGADLVSWILKNYDVEDVAEALHFAHLLASHGYIFPIDDHALTVKNDGTFYRFQTPYFWPSNCWEPENTDYAVYLCKRTMQNKTRLELADYEAENLAKLQKMFSRKWEFIFMQAESQSKVAKKRDKLERKVLDSQERAFWDVHRPMPGCVNTTEIDIKKAYRRGGSSHGTGSAGASIAKNPVEHLTRIIALRKQKLERRTIKVSKAAEALVAYYEQYNEFDYFITSPELPNPWQTDSAEMWEAEKNSKEVPLRRVKRWAFSLRELLNDPIGRDQFTKFLEKEYSGENLKFWESVQQMKALPQSEIKEAIQNIWQEFLAPDAPCPVNVDSKSVELAREAVMNSANGPNRWCFDVAASHVYHLMKSDSYSRYLRSEMYKDFLNCSRKKIKSIPNLFGVKR